MRAVELLSCDLVHVRVHWWVFVNIIMDLQDPWLDMFGSWTSLCCLLKLGFPNCITHIQGLSKRFERFKFGICYVLIVKWAQEDVETSYNLLNNNNYVRGKDIGLIWCNTPKFAKETEQYRDKYTTILGHRTKTWNRVSCLRSTNVKPLNAELNPICPLLALLGAHHILHVSRIRVKTVRFRMISGIT